MRGTREFVFGIRQAHKVIDLDGLPSKKLGIWIGSIEFESDEWEDGQKIEFELRLRPYKEKK